LLGPPEPTAELTPAPELSSQQSREKPRDAKDPDDKTSEVKKPPTPPHTGIRALLDEHIDLTAL
jgi:hypothetical protein